MVDATDADPRGDAATEPAVVIRVTRTGGVAGMRRRWRVEATAASEWEPLVDACPWDRAEADAVEPDRFVWLIEVRAPAPARSAELPESEVDGPWRELVDRVQSEGEPVPARPRGEDSHG